MEDILKDIFKNTKYKFNIQTKFFTFSLIKKLIEDGTIVIEGDAIAGAINAQAYLAGMISFGAEILPKFYATEFSDGKIHVFNLHSIKYLIDFMEDAEIPKSFSRKFFLSGIRISIFENWNIKNEYTNEDLLEFVNEYINNF